MLPDSEVARVDAQGVVVTNVYTGGETTMPGIERVVVADAAEACDELADALREQGLRVPTVGDCVSPSRRERWTARWRRKRSRRGRYEGPVSAPSPIQASAGKTRPARAECTAPASIRSAICRS